MKVAPQPCKSCPWRTTTTWAEIPEFTSALRDRLTAGINAAQDPAQFLTGQGRVMQCHDLDRDRVCAGFLLSADAVHNLTLRLAHAHGAIEGRADSGGADLHETWSAVLQQKGEV